jgi:hypothetical protein
MPDDTDFAEDEELYETDEEREDEEGDEEAAMPYMYQPYGSPSPRPPGAPWPPSRTRPPWAAPRRPAAPMRGVKAAEIRTKAGTAIVRFPTAVAPASHVHGLGQRSAQAETVLSDHERRLRALVRAERKVMYFTGGAVAMEQVRTVLGDLRTRLAIDQANSRAPATHGALVAAGVDYTLSTLEIALAAAAVPPSRRSWPFWTAPVWLGFTTSLAREFVRAPVTGYDSGKNKPATEAFTLTGSAVAALVAAFGLYPRRQELQRTLMWR